MTINGSGSDVEMIEITIKNENLIMFQGFKVFGGFLWRANYPKSNILKLKLRTVTLRQWLNTKKMETRAL